MNPEFKISTMMIIMKTKVNRMMNIMMMITITIMKDTHMAMKNKNLLIEWVLMMMN